MEGLQRRLAVARGDEPADLVVRGGRVLSVFTREWLEADVAVADGVIAGVGSYEGRESLDASGSYVVPGFIDAHMHLESVKLMVDEFARLVLPLGTTAVVADPHEIANVLGVDGVHWLLDASSGLQLDVYFMAPSCVPASPLRVSAPGADARRSRVAHAPPAGARARGDDELPRRRRWLARRAREARARRREARRRARARPARTRPPGVRGGRHLLRSRGAHGRGRSRTPPSGHVAPRPRGVDGAEPASAAAARRGVRPRAHRLLHGRSRPGGHRRRGARQRHGARGGRGRHRSRGRRRHGLASSRAVARALATRRDRARLRRGPAAPPGPRELPAVVRAEARAADRGRPARRDPGVGAAVGSDRAAHARRSRDPVERRERSRDRPRRGSGGHRVARAASLRSRAGSPSPTPIATSRRSRSSNAISQPAASVSASSPDPASSAARSPRAWRTTRTTSSSWAWTTGT